MSGPLDDLTGFVRSISPAWLARLRTGATLTVLVLLVLLAVRMGVERVSEPFPESTEPPICTDAPLQEGDTVTPADVTVSVINAGGANGLAGRTLGALTDQGFGRGQLDDAPEGTPKVVTSQIWTTEGETAAVRLVRSHLKGKVTIVDRQGPGVGITVVVGAKFKDVKNGRQKFQATGDETTCVPTVPAEVPADPSPSDDS